MAGRFARKPKFVKNRDALKKYELQKLDVESFFEGLWYYNGIVDKMRTRKQILYVGKGKGADVILCENKGKAFYVEFFKFV